jgi:hypothetical protein
MTVNLRTHHRWHLPQSFKLSATEAREVAGVAINRMIWGAYGSRPDLALQLAVPPGFLGVGYGKTRASLLKLVVPQSPAMHSIGFSPSAATLPCPHTLAFVKPEHSVKGEFSKLAAACKFKDPLTFFQKYEPGNVYAQCFCIWLVCPQSWHTFLADLTDAAMCLASIEAGIEIYPK